MVFSVHERERACQRLLERAQADARVMAGAVVGAEAHPRRGDALELGHGWWEDDRR